MLRWRRRRMPASFLLLPAICSRNSDKSHRHRRPRRETSPLASERPGGPVPLWERLACGLAVNNTPQPLRPAAAGVGGGPGKAHCASASRPPGPAQPPSPTPAARTCERACCCCLPWSTDHRPAATNPPPLPAAEIPAARRGRTDHGAQQQRARPRERAVGVGVESRTAQELAWGRRHTLPRLGAS